MAELPKIAIARLGGKPGAPKEPKDPEEGFALPGGHHPDANLLAAFAEKSLTDTEHARVMHHLAHCPDCRQVAAFVLPEAVPVESAEAATGSRLSPWPILRWGALAAMMAALAVAITLHPSLWQNHSGVTSNEPSANSAGSPPPMATAPPPAAGPPSVSANSQINAAAGKSPAQADTLNKKSLAARFVASGLESQQEAKEQVTTLDSTQPPAKIQSAPAANAAQVSGGEVAGVPAARSAPESPAQSLSPAGQQDSDSTARQGLGRTQAAAGALMSRAAVSSPAAPRWFVNSDGKVMRAGKGGNSFETVSVADGVSFRAVAAQGDEVWAGGVDGALFYSTDGGAAWTRVAVNPESGPISATITGIQIGEPRHVTVTISSGARYLSEDAGRHWREAQP